MPTYLQLAYEGEFLGMDSGYEHFRWRNARYMARYDTGTVLRLFNVDVDE